MQEFICSKCHTILTFYIDKLDFAPITGRERVAKLISCPQCHADIYLDPKMKKQTAANGGVQIRCGECGGTSPISSEMFGEPDIEQLKKSQDLDGLIGALRHELVQVRCDAVQALREIKDTRVVVALTNTLQDEDPKVRLAAQQALEALKDYQILQTLATVLTGEDHAARQETLDTLSDPNDPQTEKLLTAIIRNSRTSDEMRWAAVQILNKYKASRLDSGVFQVDRLPKGQKGS